MRKLSLTLDDLNVESFTTSEARSHRGTVHAHTGADTVDVCCQAGTHGGGTCDSTCFQIICTCTGGFPNNTCDISCGGTCAGGESCQQGCETWLGCPTNPGYPGC